MAIAVAVTLHAAMNWRFGHMVADTERDAHVLGALFVAFDVTCALSLHQALKAVGQGAWVRAILAAVVWLATAAISFTSAVGFAALNRDAVTAEQKARSQAIAVAREDHARASAALEMMQTNPRWAATAACTDATAPKSVAFCEAVRVKQGEIRDAMARMGDGVERAADPGAALVARLTGTTLEDAQLALPVGVALVSIIVSALGVSVFALPGAKRRPQAKAPARRRRKSRPRPANPPGGQARPAASQGNVVQLRSRARP